MKNIDKYLSILGNDVDGLLLSSRHSRHYGAEFDIAEGIAVVTKSGCRYFTDSRYIESAQNNIHGFEVTMTDHVDTYSVLLNRAIHELGIKKLGYEENYLSAAELIQFQQQLHAELVPVNDKIHRFRWVKEEWELQRMKKAQSITDKAFSQILTRIQAGMTEKQLQAELIYCLYKNGADGLAFSPIVVSGPNTSLPHGVPGDRVIENGDFITMDFGAMLQGYCSDMTRTVAVGYATEEMEKVYNTVLQAQIAGLAATKAGIPGKQVDAAAREYIQQAGYGEYFGHGYGHCLGMEVHEEPRCAITGETIMEENMVCSAEPGIYLPGKFGVRIEDVVIFKADGCENITQSPKNLIIV